MTEPNQHYVTPEEAKDRKCQMGKSSSTYIQNWCDGPKCMAWRWKEGTNKYWIWAEDSEKKDPPSHWIPIEQWMHGERRAGKFREGPTHGYCGMVKS